MQQHLRDRTKPDVLILQETHGLAKLPGYQAIGPPTGDIRTLTTLVRKGLVAICHDTRITEIEHILVQLAPKRKKSPSIFILNLYSNPTRIRQRFLLLFKKAVDIAGPNPLVIGGDFNAPHSAWGYGYTRAKGKTLWQDIQETGLTLITDPDSPTRMGTGLARDTTPDLTLVRNAGTAKWKNTFDDLGSDHRILEIRIETMAAAKIQRQIRWTDWDKFRKVRNAKKQDPISNIEDWIKDVNNDVSEAPKLLLQISP